MLELSPTDMAAVRSLSKTVFGQEQRLPLMLLIRDLEQPFTLTDLVVALGLQHPSVLQKPLAALAAADVIRRQPVSAGERFRYYVRNGDSNAWAFAEELLLVARRGAGSPVQDDQGASVTRIRARRASGPVGGRH